jgi:CheY-like chemotaxis protein
MNRVLIADDDAAIRRMLTRFLTSEGYAVETAADGKEAWDRIQTSPPDLLLLDLHMPVWDGWQLYAALRRNGQSQLPIVVMSAGERLKTAREQFPDVEVVAKPFDFDELLVTLHNRVNRKAA